jgi:glucan phosphoethanolaminetransferase (alkaline phosphatase superfamily)
MQEGRGMGASVRDILHLGLSGLVAGGFAGLAEFLFRRATEGHQFPTSDLLPYMLFYGLIWATFGVVLALVLAAVSLRRPRPSSWVRTAGSSIVVASVPAGLIGSYVNGKLLPGMLAPSSLLFDALVLVGAAVAAVCVFRAVERRRRAGSPRVWLKSPLGVATFLWICLIVIASVVPASDDAPPVAPVAETSADINILLLLVDALRADHLGCYGYERDTSPDLDQLAEEGILFENAYTQAPVTKASTASLVTSLYPSSHRVRGITDALPEDTPVLMEEMQKLGCRTALLSANAFL